MAQIVLIRPGKTDFDEQNRIQGTLDIPLNEEGTHEVEQVVQRVRQLPLKAVFCSPCEPAVGTAQTIGKALGVRVSRLDELRNVNQGLWQGLKIEEVRRKHPRVYKQWEESPESVCPPEGETLAEAYNRVDEAMKNLLRRHKRQMIAIVACEPIASVIRCNLKRSGLGEMKNHANGSEKWEVLEAPVT